MLFPFFLFRLCSSPSTCATTLALGILYLLFWQYRRFFWKSRGMLPWYSKTAVSIPETRTRSPPVCCSKHLHPPHGRAVDFRSLPQPSP